MGEGRDEGEVVVEANFTVHRFRRDERVGQYVGRYRYRLRVTDRPRLLVASQATRQTRRLTDARASYRPLP